MTVQKDGSVNFLWREKTTRSLRDTININELAVVCNASFGEFIEGTSIQLCLTLTTCDLSRLTSERGNATSSHYGGRIMSSSTPSDHVSAFPAATFDTAAAAGRQHVIDLLKHHTCYDPLPVSFKVVVLDTRLLVKKGLAAMLQNGGYHVSAGKSCIPRTAVKRPCWRN